MVSGYDVDIARQGNNELLAGHWAFITYIGIAKNEGISLVTTDSIFTFIRNILLYQSSKFLTVALEIDIFENLFLC